jgi:hypothetical protein
MILPDRDYPKLMTFFIRGPARLSRNIENDNTFLQFSGGVWREGTLRYTYLLLFLRLLPRTDGVGVFR